MLVTCTIVFLCLYFSSLILLAITASAFFINKVIRRGDTSIPGYWDIPKTIVCKICDWHSRVFHGYELVGIENVPTTGPALIVCYHGAVFLDHCYVIGKVWLEIRRVVFSYGSKGLLKLPGLGMLAEAMHVISGSKEECVHALKTGNLMIIAPGGVYEAQFGDSNYELLWRNRLGFAKIAIESKVPIIPMFTENYREGYKNATFCQSVVTKFYESTKLPLRLVYGAFPVKLRTYLGKPIEYDPTVTPEELREKVIKALEDLIVENQRLPGNLWHALIDRCRTKVPVNVAENRDYLMQCKKLRGNHMEKPV